MSLSISESMDLNTALSYLLAIETDHCPLPGPGEARDAALRLTAKAHRTLSAGLMPHQVSEAWPMPNRKPRKGAPK